VRGLDSRGQLTDFQRIVAFFAVVVAVLLAAMALGWQNVWLLVAATGVVAIVVVTMIMTALRRTSQRRELTTARVLAVNTPPPGSIVGRCEARLRVHVPGRAPVETRWRDPAVPLVRWPMPGQTLPVDVRGGNPRRVKVRWDLIDQGYVRAPEPTPTRAGSTTPVPTSSGAGPEDGTAAGGWRSAGGAPATEPAPQTPPPGRLTVAPAQRDPGQRDPGQRDDATQRLDATERLEPVPRPESTLRLDGPHTAVWPIDDGEWPVTTSTVAAGIDPRVPRFGSAPRPEPPADRESPERDPSPTIRLHETWSDPDDPLLTQLGLAGSAATDARGPDRPAEHPDAYAGTLAGSTTVVSNGHDPDGYDPDSFEQVRVVQLGWTPAGPPAQTPPSDPLEPPFPLDPPSSPGQPPTTPPVASGTDQLVHLDLPEFDPSQVDWSDFQHDEPGPHDDEQEPLPEAGHGGPTDLPAASIPAPRPAQEPIQGLPTQNSPDPDRVETPPDPERVESPDLAPGVEPTAAAPAPQAESREPAGIEPSEPSEPTGQRPARTGRPWEWDPPSGGTRPRETRPSAPSPPPAAAEPPAGPWHGAPARVRRTNPPAGGTSSEAVPVTDLERAQRFYARLLGLEPTSSSATSVVLEGRGARVELRREPDPALTGSGHVRVPVLDIEAVCARLRARGIAVVRPPAPVDPAEPDLWQARVRDPDGNAVTLIEQRQRP